MGKAPLILLLENEENDVFFFRRALAACHFDGDVRIVETMAQARDYLEGVGEYRDRSYYRLPDLIVTDFKLPGQTGVEFLQWIAKRPEYKRIPVVMFSGSALPADRAAALTGGALAFFTKSGNFQEICECVESILKYMRKPKP